MDENSSTAPSRFTVFGRGSYTEALRIGAILRKETVGWSLLVAAALIALIWANSPASESYFAVRILGSVTRPGTLNSALVPGLRTDCWRSFSSWWVLSSRGSVWPGTFGSWTRRVFQSQPRQAE